MIVGVPEETVPGERRTAMTPTAAALLIKSKLEVLVETGAGIAAGFEDAAYTAKGAKVAPRAQVLASADILLQIQHQAPGPILKAQARLPDDWILRSAGLAQGEAELAPSGVR